MGTTGGEGTRGGGADAGACTTDEDDFSCQIQHAVLLFING
jgi:hypothetical protein